MANPSVSIPDDLLERVDGQLEYGDHRSEWIQEAIREKLERDEEADTGNATPSPAAMMTSD